MLKFLIELTNNIKDKIIPFLKFGWIGVDEGCSILLEYTGMHIVVPKRIRNVNRSFIYLYSQRDVDKSQILLQQLTHLVKNSLLIVYKIKYPKH